MHRSPASHLLACVPLFLLVSAAGLALAAESKRGDTSRGDKLLADYFREETALLGQQTLAEIKTRADWDQQRGEARRELFEMLGLDPLPEKTDLQPVVTGRTMHEDFTVERLHFQSRPGLYVTANLYVPNGLSGPAPAVLYVCGHGGVVRNGIRYGNKVHYQHHGSWYAQHGFVCLSIDTLQLGEIAGLHHGTHNLRMWWWNNRGYTPAGVEAWNCIRALDYLQTRPEVDAKRMGVAGRSGGGAYSWWIAALDDRIQAAVPVAGITDLKNHVVDGCVRGHCDCMYQVNTYRWDFAKVAALVAPRPLLIGNTDADRIFPLDGVQRVYEQTKRIYKLYDAEEKIALALDKGGHADTTVLQAAEFAWFEKHLQGKDRPSEDLSEKFFQPEQLRVLKGVPDDALNGEIQESFTQQPQFTAPPRDKAAWEEQRDAWLAALREKSFRGWPAEPGQLNLKQRFTTAHDGVELAVYDFTSQHHVPLELFVTKRAGLEKPSLMVLNVLDEEGWREMLAMLRPSFERELADYELPAADAKGAEQHQKMFKSFPWVMAYLAPRGIGPTAWSHSGTNHTHIRRRFMLLGQTLHGMQVWDTRRGMQALRSAPGLEEVPLWLQATGPMAGVALYGSLFEPAAARLDLHALPTTHRDGPIFLNVSRYLDLPQAAAMAAERSHVVLYHDQPEAWSYASDAVKQLNWGEKHLSIRKPTP